MPTDLPLGQELHWTPAHAPRPIALRGSHVLVRPLDAAGDAAALYSVSHAPHGDPALWTYLPYGPYDDLAGLSRVLAAVEGSRDPLYFVLAPLPEETPLGVTAYLHITPEHGVLEIGHVWFGAGLARSTAATEAIFLLLRHAFDELGYRRVEWKCNALNAASRRAAERFGFAFEGVFHSHMVVKGRNRDTAWFAITRERWPAIRLGFELWIAPENMDASGQQLRALGELIEEASRRRGADSRSETQTIR